LRHVQAAGDDPAVLVGLGSPDDAGVYRVAPDLAIVQTVDFFTPIVDDPYAWGSIAAANALSDIYAMGANPVTALNLVGWPRTLDFEILGSVLEGGSAKCSEAGVTVIGGHSVDDPEPKFGLAITGIVDPERVIRTTGASPGCDLVLTKPLGMGVISSALKEGVAPPGLVEEATEIMAALNAGACDAMLEVGVEAATDVTGFGLMGHLREMLDGRLDATVRWDDVPLLEESIGLAARGILAGGSKRNLESVRPYVDSGGLDDARRAVLFDAQTSGGLLIAVSPARTPALLEALRTRRVDRGGVIGTVVEGTGRIEVIA
jgi:selenide, water dikinase